MIRTTLGALAAANHGAIAALMSFPVPVKEALHRVDLIALIEAQTVRHEKVRRGIVEKYGVRSSSGRIDVPEMIDGEANPAFAKAAEEMTELDNTVAHIDAEPLPLPENGNISPIDIRLLLAAGLVAR